MLILTRMADKSLMIGETHVTVLSVKGKQFRIGITEDPDMKAHRTEIYDRIQADKLKKVNTELAK